MLGGVLAELVTTVTLVFIAHLGAKCRAENDFHSVTLPEWTATSEYVMECFSNKHLTCDWTSSQIMGLKGVKLNNLESHPLTLVGQACLEFWFLAPAASKGSEIRALLKSSTSLVEIWTSPSHPRDAWRKVSVPLTVSEPGTRVVFEAVESVSLDQTTLKQIGVGDSCGNQCDSDLDLWTDDSTHCLCSVGQLSCFPSQCPEKGKCGPQRGISNRASASGVCTVHHHIHYTTFDGVAFRFMSPCSYVLAKTCSPTETLPRFTVEVVNEQNSNASLQTVEQIVVDLGNIRLSLLKSQMHWVVVNGVWQKLPLNLNHGTIHIKGKPSVILETSFGLSVSFDGAGDVHITVPLQYSDKVCGMCGNFNFLRGDDFNKPDGSIAESTLAFAESWKTEPTALCKSTLVPQLCDPLVEANYGKELYCGRLLSGTGPFANCLSVLEAESYFRACVSGMCSGDQGMLCKTFIDYADACREAGIAVHISTTVCPFQCSENSHYNSCADGCPEVCSALDLPSSCGRCEERCECNSGYRLSGDTCVSTEHCGCWYNRKHYAKGDIFVDENCMQQCQCMGNTVQCTAIQCGHDEVCKEKDGVNGCFPVKPVTCSVYGDPHFITFDNSVYDFQGGCGYTLTTTCGGQTPVQFTVTGFNAHPDTQNFTRSKLQAVSLQVDDLHLTLNQSGEVYVHGSQVGLPYYTNNAYGLVWVYEKMMSVVLETTFGLKMGIDGHNRLFLQVDERYKYELCGLCGTYSDYQGDDFAMPSGEIAAEPFQFADSWRVNDECIIHPNNPRQCVGEERNEAERDCSAVLGDAFHACHEHVHPTIYLNSCVYDYCDTSGDQTTLCESIKSYVAACQVVGVELSDWWTGTACADLLTTSASTTQHPDQTLCPLNCNFDLNICGWEQLIQDSFDWTRHSGPTSSNLTGPNYDHTTGAGFYMYIEGDGVSHGDSARMMSSVCHYGGPLCLHFWYYMYGSATSMALSTYLLQNNKATKLWSVRNNQGSKWHLASVDIKAAYPFQIIMEGIRGSNALSDVAIDDISISLGSCSDFTQKTDLLTTEVLPSHPICSFDCSFNSTLCAWNKMTTDSFDWRIKDGSNPIVTIPADHTGDGFLYVETSTVTWSDSARLISSECSNIGPQCLQFWYYMHGSANAISLQVYLLQNSVADSIWKKNDQGTSWHLAQVDFNTTQAFQVIIEGRRGINEQSDVAIDDIKLYAGQCSEVAALHPTQHGQSTMAPSVQVPTTVVPVPTLAHVTNSASEPPVLQVVTEAPVLNVTAVPPLATVTPVLTSVPPLATVNPVLNVTAVPPLATVTPVLTSAPPLATVNPVLNVTSAPPLATVNPVLNVTSAPPLATVTPVLTSVPPLATVSPVLNVTAAPPLATVTPVLTSVPPVAPVLNATTVHPIQMGCQLDCDFEKDLCQWSQMLTDVFDWERHGGPTTTLSTGPPSDHTTGGGHYLYIEASKATLGDTARLISSDCSKTGPQCLQFWYHMFGSANTMGLQVYLLQNSVANSIWRKKNDQGNLWHLAQVDFMVTQAFQVIIEGRRGTNEQSDVAIDDIKLYAGRCSEVAALHPTQHGQSTMAPSVQVPTTVVPVPTLAHVTNSASEPPVLQVVTEAPVLNVTAVPPLATVSPVLTSVSPLATVSPVLNVTSTPALATVSPVLNVTSAPPLATVSPVLTSVPPLATVSPVLNVTAAPPLATVTPVLTSVPPLATVNPVLNVTTAPPLATMSPVLTSVPPLATISPVLNVTLVPPLATISPVLNVTLVPPLATVTPVLNVTSVPPLATVTPVLNATSAPPLATVTPVLNATSAPPLATVTPVLNATTVHQNKITPSNVQVSTTVVPKLHVTNGAPEPTVLKVVTEAPMSNVTTVPSVQNKGCQLDCDFETDLCHWSQMLTDVFDWERHSGPTPTMNTGPPSDHTTGGGHYLYIEATKAIFGDTARLISSDCSNIGLQCLQFWYHMYGSANTMGLQVYLLQNSVANAIWWKKNDQGTSWHLAQVDFNTTQAFQVIIEGRRGTNEQSDVAIDDIKLYAGQCSEVAALHPTQHGQSTMAPSVQVPTTVVPVPTLAHVTNSASEPPVLQVVTEAPVLNVTTVPPLSTVAPVLNVTTAPPVAPMLNATTVHQNTMTPTNVQVPTTVVPMLNVTNKAPEPPVLQVVTEAPVLNVTTAPPLAPVLNVTTALPLATMAPVLNATTAHQNTMAPMLNVTNRAPEPPVLQVVTKAPILNVTTAPPLATVAPVLNATTVHQNTMAPTNVQVPTTVVPMLNVTNRAPEPTVQVVTEAPVLNVTTAPPLATVAPVLNATTVHQNTMAPTNVQVPTTVVPMLNVTNRAPEPTVQVVTEAPVLNVTTAPPLATVAPVLNATTVHQNTMAPTNVQVPTTVVPMLNVTNRAPEPPVLQVVTEAPVLNVTTAPPLAPVLNVTTELPIQHLGCQLDCDFEKDLCQWSQMLTDAFDWKRHKGPTPTLNTGPPSDHTTGGGYYLYIEAKKATFGDTARIISSECSVAGPQCLQFWYHMYGSADTMGLQVYLLQNGKTTAVWRKTNNQGNLWHLAQINLVTTGTFQIIFEGRRGSNDQSDVAIDDILLHHGFCEDLIKPVTQAPVTLSPLTKTSLAHTTIYASMAPSAGQSVQTTSNPTTHAATPTCAKNSHYTTCVPACSPTCAHLHGPPHCSANKICTSGCACDKDFVRDGRLCVPIQKCGCIDGNGTKNSFNEVWYTNHCSQKCECDGDDGYGKIDCHDEGCDDDEVCLQSAMGQFYCATTDFSECTIEGDPEYKTFDKMKHDFKGKHLYVLVRTKNLPSNLPDIYIEGSNSCSDDDGEGGENRSSQSSEDGNQQRYQELKIKVYNHTVALKQQRKVFVDGRQIQTPISPVPGLNIHEHYSRIYLRTDFGFAVEFSGQCKAEIILPHLYKRRVEGLCGNFDGRKGNDKVKPDGTMAKGIEEFGESWRV